MNIPAKTIADQIANQVAQLQQAITSGDERTVNECAISIEAYCQLLKGTTTETNATQPTIQPAQQTMSYNQIAQPTPIVQAPITEPEEKRNLLDF